MTDFSTNMKWFKCTETLFFAFKHRKALCQKGVTSI